MGRKPSEYPRGYHPNSLKNLRPFGTLTAAEQRRLSIKGGKQSGRSRAFDAALFKFDYERLKQYKEFWEE